MGFFSTALLAVNNLRDVDQDRKVNKRTLAVRFGKGIVKIEYVLHGFWVLDSRFLSRWRLDQWIGLISIISMLFAIKPKMMMTLKGKPLNDVLGRTSGFSLFLQCY